MIRTHTCGELSAANLGQKITLAGWVDAVRDLGGLLFIDLRDTYGLTQLNIGPEADAALRATAAKLHQEWVIKAAGEVVARPQNMVNKAMPTGEIEIKITALEVLSPAETLPFAITNEAVTGAAGEALRLQYRYLDLRRPKMQAMLTERDKFIKYLRDYFHNLGWREIQTPILANSSPEGARDFLIPSRLHPGKFYALPQAPQLFKQLLMVGGVDRYFQIAPCFRDEDVRADRHYGEFYQLDMEMSFAEAADVFAVMEPLMKQLTEKFSAKKIIKLEADGSFKKIPWREVLTAYGTDKPDLRYDLKITAVSKELDKSGFSIFDQALAAGGVVHALAVAGKDFSRKIIDEVEALAKSKGAGGLAYFILEQDGCKGGLTKFVKTEVLTQVAAASGAVDGDIVFLAAGKWRTVCAALGAVREECAKRLELKDKTKAAWCWIIDYPMFEEVEEGSLAAKQGKKIDFGHNPFSLPQGGTEALNNRNPLEILAHQYDLVLNGYEISSGAVRNYQPEIMYKVFAIGGYSKEEVDKKFGALLKAFRYGAPPHAGNAPGIDRLLMVLKDWESIRDIYAFPKDGHGRDLLMDSPSEVDAAQLAELKIKPLS